MTMWWYPAQTSIPPKSTLKVNSDQHTVTGGSNVAVAYLKEYTP